MPFTGIYADNDHVLGHEIVHVFQYDIAEGTPGGGLMRLDALPLWLIEGMAEYFSLGREDPLTAMWMRDAVTARQVARRSSSSRPTRASSRIDTARRCGRTSAARWGDAERERCLSHGTAPRMGRRIASSGWRFERLALEGVADGNPSDVPADDGRSRQADRRWSRTPRQPERAGRHERRAGSESRRQVGGVLRASWGCSRWISSSPTRTRGRS